MNSNMRMHTSRHALRYTVVMSAPHPIIVLGTPEFAVPSLQALAKHPAFKIQLVVTRRDAPVGRKQILTPPPMKIAAEALGIPVFQPAKVNDELPKYLEEHSLERPDFLVTVAYGHILSQRVLDIPAIAPVNLHGSVLPRWRGASPIEHAILNGDRDAGVSVQIMVKELDAGPVLAAKSIPLTETATALSLRTQLAELGAQLLVDTLAAPLKPVPQDDSQATFCGKLSREDGQLDPSVKSAEEIDRAVRALTPWPGVTVSLDGTPLKLLQSSLTPQAASAPLQCAKGTTLHLVTVQPAGKKPMSGKDWANGLRNTGGRK